ncbi:MAG TPA: ATP-binding cassette domain-containing protein [Puia sp.]|nr:ATP-binding cassette domain-containing protein [Puia sp.]
MAAPFLTLEGVSVQLAGARLLAHLDWTIHTGEQWAITGPSGSGKTLLAHTLLGRHFYTGTLQIATKRIAMVEQQHRFRNRPGATELYYQQRFNASDADQTITVAQELADAGYPDPDPALLESLHILPLLQKPLIQLSNGENKRVQLALAVLEAPELLILDNPFLGLDTDGRATLHTIINSLAGRGIQLLLITNGHELPTAITHVARLDHGEWSFLGLKAAFHPDLRPQTKTLLDPTILATLRAEAAAADNGHEPFAFAVKMEHTTIRYGENIILDDIQWQVRKGERWNVSGPNGAGKSTLLSLVTADNPQAYANEIWLFDRRRGTGETIWEIKKKIGFVSPELHLYFDTAATVFDVIASGLFDTIGLFRTLSDEQTATVLLWMQLLSLHELRHRRLVQLSTGGQRMVLLARALIKNPPMLILDEPCQGLDDEQTAYFRELVTTLCETFGTTLIYVSHYQQELPSCIDHWLRLEKGLVV